MGSNRLPSEHVDPSPLGKPLHFEFADKTAPNRFMKAAMTERLSTWDPKDLLKRGIPTKNLINVYRRWGEGAFGVILTGNIMIDYDQLEAAGNPIIPQDASFSGERFEAFKELAVQAKKHGALCVGQVSHPGRQVESRIQPNPISASDVQLEGNIMGMQFAKPHPATQEEINSVVNGFTHAAEFLHKAGYDGIELHGAHGYLLAQFLSLTTNKRTDKYGGSLANRSRIILEIAKSIRSKLPVSTGFVIGIKLNSVEFQDGGFSAEECRDLCSSLENEGQFDFVELSGGTYQSLAFSHQRESTKKREAFFLEFADIITPALKKTKTYVTGGLRTVPGMTKALESVDGVGLARPVCQEPRLPKDILEGKVASALDQKLDQQNFGLTNVAAGTQIRQVGKDQEPIDLSKQENVDAFNRDMEAWGEKMAQNSTKMDMYGYVDIVSQEGSPYGSAAGAA
jgi:2,4-dienoyl-CoA reductase-like NADH-dependent reductase (Old Yellow Enzyme family)